ncbi:MAG: cation-efflux pump, partial [Mesorhizobium sp.]
MTAIDSKNAAKRKVASLALWSIIVAFVVLGLKLAAWYVTGSVALYS